MKRLKPSDLNLIGELANQHPELKERLTVIRSHLAFSYGQQCGKDICSSAKVAKNPERAAEIRANWTDE